VVFGAVKNVVKSEDRAMSDLRIVHHHMTSRGQDEANNGVRWDPTGHLNVHQNCWRFDFRRIALALKGHHLESQSPRVQFRDHPRRGLPTPATSDLIMIREDGGSPAWA